MNQRIVAIKIYTMQRLLSLTISVLSIIVIITGCSHSANFIKTGPFMVAKPGNCPIEVFNSKNPEREYQELGVIESEGQYGYDSFEKVLPELKEEACENGGDAIIIKSIQKYVDNSNSEKIYINATVIKWLD